MSDPIEAIRWVNLSIAFVAFLWMLLRMTRNWENYETIGRLYSSSLAMFALAILYGTAEILGVTGTSVIRVFLISIALIFLVAALAISRKSTPVWQDKQQSRGRSDEDG